MALVSLLNAKEAWRIHKEHPQPGAVWVLLSGLLRVAIIAFHFWLLVNI
ncbi:hypothetical protein [Acanthopleuribacter pedis]|uniref:Uncharacterized protein n=1 Tax=Acanthopleuribacter pedis TaxID=442870 RepID=A0A8J7Q477_9BACT|nr:hypothetical protein [Acanthopleuribacter pedis]MBO1317401.1 hypothetical protein [Acanthopleuribacter pedis]